MFKPRTLFRTAVGYAQKNGSNVSNAILVESIFWVALMTIAVVYFGEWFAAPTYYLLIAADAVFGWLPFVNIIDPDMTAMGVERWAGNLEPREAMFSMTALFLCAAPVIVILEVMIASPDVKQRG